MIKTGKISFLFISVFIPFILNAQNDGIKLMSFNILRGDLNGPDHLWELRRQAVLDMIGADAPDVIGLQECNLEQREDIRTTYGDYSWTGIQVSGDTTDSKCSGNYIFYRNSRFNRLDAGTFWFSDSGEPGSFVWGASKPRNCNWILLEDKSNGAKFYYFCMHTQNGVDAANSRSMSNVLLLAKMREINRENLPAVFSGDLNCNAKEYYFDDLRHYFKEACETCVTSDTGRTFNGFNDGKSKSRLDHIFYNGFKGIEFAVERNAYAGVTYLSDHYPVWAYLEYDGGNTVDIHDETELKGDEPVVTFATYNVWNDRHRLYNIETTKKTLPQQSWNNTADAVISLICSTGADMIGLQDMSCDQISSIPKLLAKVSERKYKLWSVAVQPSNMEKSYYLGLLYDSRRFGISSQNMFWFSDTPETESLCDKSGQYFACICAVARDKVTGKEFFVMCTKMPAQNVCKAKHAEIIRKMEKTLNGRSLPVVLLADTNAPVKSASVLGMLNHYLDTYAVQKEARDSLEGTVSGTLCDDNAVRTVKKDYVCVRNLRENGIRVISHKVLRDKVEIDGESVYPSWHCPVFARMAIIK